MRRPPRDTIKYILGGPDGHLPVPIRDVLVWAEWWEKVWKRAVEDPVWGKSAENPMRVGWTEVGDFEVSTVFLGTDYSFGVGPHPICFETAVFGLPGGTDIYRRYVTWEDALAGHQAVVARLASGLPLHDEEEVRHGEAP